MRLIACTLVAALSAGVVHAGEAPAPDGDGWRRFEVLVERNIFSRERGRRETVTRSVPRPEAAPPPERSVVLMGIMRQGDGWIAFLEDARTGQVHKVGVGDAILEGRVAAIGMDSIQYAKGDRALTVPMGGSLEDRSAQGTVTDVGAPSAGGEGAPALSGEPADLLERLRQRRQRELGQ